jgi:Flp pilus assembly protein TadD
MTRFAFSFSALLLCGSVTGCASDTMNSLGAPGHPKIASAGNDALPTDLDSGVRQAQLERVAGNYDQAIHTLSQLMLVASDDPRVVGEYGKTLAEQGRGQEAVQFLTRASELQPKDWTLFSALGVAYDELGQDDQAAKAYQRALVLSPHESAVFNNYALSRMMANDPTRARQLMAEAEQSGGGADPKIARNIALVKSLAINVPAEAPKAQAASIPVPGPGPVLATPSHPLAPVAQKPAPQVVMEPVPADPLAGPVKSRPKARPAVPEEKAAKAAEVKAEPAKSAIPELRQTASAY